jgi:flagellin
MGLRINHNLASLGAALNLGRANSALSSSLAKLSTGLKINTASDGPADLIISEKFRSQINAISKATENTQNAISMLSTAEGALAEVNALLNKMQGLALKATQTGTQSTEEIAASQAEIDSALASIDSISRNTSFGSVNLLDGSQSIQTTSVDTNKILVNIDEANFAGDIKNLAVTVVKQSERASTTVDLTNQAVAGTLDKAQVIKVTGNRGSTTITFAAGSTVADIAEEINSQVGQTGVVATLRDQNSNGTNDIVTLQSAKYGASEYVIVEDVDGDNDLLTTVPQSSFNYRVNSSSTGVDLYTSEAYKDYTFIIDTSATAGQGQDARVDASSKTIYLLMASDATSANVVTALNDAVSTALSDSSEPFSAASTWTITASARQTLSAVKSDPPVVATLKDEANINTFTFEYNTGTDNVTFDGSTLTLGVQTAINNTQDILNRIDATLTADESAYVKNTFDFTVNSPITAALFNGANDSSTTTPLIAIGSRTSFVKATGVDGDLEVNGVKTAANNLTFTFDNGNIRGDITINEDFNGTNNTTSFALSGKGAFLQIGSKAQLSHQIGVGIKSVATDQLASSLYLNSAMNPTSSSVNDDDTLYTTATLADIKAGGEFDLASNAQTAYDIINKAITEVSVQRSKLGALISNTLESNINSLGVSFENLTASESRIRDVDFAAETAEFTRAQILVQAGTSVAAQANVATQAALQLLG